MRRSPRVYVAWFVVALAALFTARVVAVDLGTLHARARTVGRDVAVVTARRDLALGVTVAPSDVQIVRRPSATVAPDALRDVSEAEGRVVSVPVLAGDPVRAQALAPVDRTGLDGIVPPGRRAVHVVLDDGFRPAPGAVVDVLASSDPEIGAYTGAVAAGTATVIAHGARVLAVDDTEGITAAGTSSALTILVTEPEARDVVYAAANGRIAVVLAPPEDVSVP
jgi:Flp pilus assembly protein CpaB